MLYYVYVLSFKKNTYVHKFTSFNQLVLFV